MTNSQRQQSNKIATSIKDFYTCQGVTRGDLLAMINPTLLTRAWALLKEVGENEYSAYSLIQDWNKVTNGAPFEYASVQKYMDYYAGSCAGSKRQEYVATAVRRVMSKLPPSENLGSGKLNSVLINLAWKLLRSFPDADMESFVQQLHAQYLKSHEDPTFVKFKAPAKNKIPNQDIIKEAVSGAVRVLKSDNFAPAQNRKITTKTAGIINAVAWKLFSKGDCTTEAVLKFVKGKSAYQIQQDLAVFA